VREELPALAAGADVGNLAGPGMARSSYHEGVLGLMIAAGSFSFPTVPD